ncbi:MAG TPA: hypothetical protein PLB89_14995 [Flavobacteriales bacterium]|nr:hypothetical protein [Flavobacteriales bacterium]
MATYIPIDQLREAVHQATRRTVRRLWITCAMVIMMWGAVIALAT